MISAGIDDRLAKHVAHLFIRDPLTIFEGQTDLDNTTTTDHFENIQSTNWNTVRLKPPPFKSDIGWRVEFRSMDIQLTDFENAAFAILVVLTSRIILAYRLNLYIPMSKVDSNMATAHERDAVREQKFFFRRNIFHDATIQPPDSFLCSCGRIHHPEYNWDFDFACNQNSEPNAFELMSLDEIFNGKEFYTDSERDPGFAFPGLIPLVKAYLYAIKVEGFTLKKITRYLDFVSARASGELVTLAAWMRMYVSSHEKYEKDSVVSEEICADLIEILHDIEKGNQACPELFGSFYPCNGAPEVCKHSVERILTADVPEESALLHGQSMSHSAMHRAFESIVAHQKK
uniref:Glutamate--cysteine ligase n=1 Tax=Timspurckia oligopyrenoides TaxID=708627 RepID=A0A7S0ZH96_9RHOD